MGCVSSASRLAKFISKQQTLWPQPTLLTCFRPLSYNCACAVPRDTNYCTLVALFSVSCLTQPATLWPAYRMCAVRRQPLVPGVCAGPAGDDEGASGPRGVGCPGLQEPDSSAGGARPQRLPLRQGDRNSVFSLSLCYFGGCGAGVAPFLGHKYDTSTCISCWSAVS